MQTVRMKVFLALILMSLVASLDAAGMVPRVWMSTQWQSGMDAVAADLVAHGVDVMQVPPWNISVCRESLRICRKYGLKGFTYTTEPSLNSKWAVAGKPYECAVMVGGAYRGLALDRNLFSFTPAVHDVVIEPPVYSVRQPYTSRKHGKTVKSGHYFGSRIPVRAEVIVPLKPFDGKQHLKIIPCDLLPVESGMKPENDTVTDAMRGSPEIEKRRLVRIRFDLSPFKDAMLDKVGIAVYWENDTESDVWKSGIGTMSVFSEHTQAFAEHDVSFRLKRFAEANGGIFPDDVICGIRFGDECFNITGWLDCPAASYPIYGYSKSGLAAFRKLVPDGVEPPRVAGHPEIYGRDAYGAFLYNYHKGCADLVKVAVAAARRVAPNVKVFRNTTRGDAWSYGNDHDGSGQELLARELDMVHLDPYPVAAHYAADKIPFDMAYLAGLSRRYGKPLMPWVQAHAYAPNGLAHVKPEQIERMWEQHKVHAPDAIMWLGYGRAVAGECTMTFPDGNTNSWEKATEVHRSFKSVPLVKPIARLAVVRPYATRALVCDLPGWKVLNPADVLLGEFARAWSVDLGRAYDVFEVPPFESEAEKTKRIEELKKYEFIVSTEQYPGAQIIGMGTEGQVWTRRQINEFRQQCVGSLKEKGVVQ